LAASCGDSGSSSGGGGGASTSSGVGAAPTTKYVGSVTVSTDETDGTASATFGETANQFCATKAFGACTLHQCDFDNDIPPEVDAGNITVAGAAIPIKLVADATGDYASVESDAPLFSGGETLTFSATGATVSAFQGSVVAPTGMDVSDVDASDRLFATEGQDLTVHWSGGSGDVATYAFTVLDANELDFLVCMFDRGTGAGTIPGDALQFVSKQGQTTYWGATTDNSVTKVFGETTVTMLASISALNPSSGNAAVGELRFSPAATTSGGQTTTGGGCTNGEGGMFNSSCTCAEQYPAGYEKATDYSYSECGCASGAPCHSACANDKRCGGASPVAGCASCIQEQAASGSQCSYDAFNLAYNDPVSADYALCELNGG